MKEINGENYRICYDEPLMCYLWTLIRETDILMGKSYSFGQAKKDLKVAMFESAIEVPAELEK